jgi:hypothetical protein
LKKKTELPSFLEIDFFEKYKKFFPKNSIVRKLIVKGNYENKDLIFKINEKGTFFIIFLKKSMKISIVIIVMLKI